MTYHITIHERGRKGQPVRRNLEVLRRTEDFTAGLVILEVEAGPGQVSADIERDRARRGPLKNHLPCPVCFRRTEHKHQVRNGWDLYECKKCGNVQSYDLTGES